MAKDWEWEDQGTAPARYTAAVSFFQADVKLARAFSGRVRIGLEGRTRFQDVSGFRGATVGRDYL